MKQEDEITALAIEYLEAHDRIVEHVGPAFEQLERAPLAQLIDKYLERYPRIEYAATLERIAATNQGRLEDLNAPLFQSYLISKCDVDNLMLRKLIGSLHRFYESSLHKINAGEPMFIAARDEENSGRNSAKFDDIQRLMKKRVR
jgi:hypothetical protein